MPVGARAPRAARHTGRVRPVFVRGVRAPRPALSPTEALLLASLLKSLYHVTVPLRVRRALRLTRFTPSRQGRARLWRQTQGRVAAGPFAGMRLAGDLPDDSAPNELLGSFECELHPWIDAELARGWGTVVNIGSGGGYYSTEIGRAHV